MFDKINTTIDIFEKAVITIGMAAGTLLLFTNVVLRYLFDSGITWVLEAVQYIFAWVVLIGAAHGVKAGIHLGIDILVEKFPAETQRIISLIAAVLSLLFVATVFVLSIQYTIKVYSWGDLSLDLQIPQWIPYLAIPIGLFLMLYHLLRVTWMIWKGDILHIHASEASKALEELQR
ncbi:TRAP transporter small permease [Kaarinaea lacus]